MSLSYRDLNLQNGNWITSTRKFAMDYFYAKLQCAIYSLRIINLINTKNKTVDSQLIRKKKKIASENK